MSKNIIIPDYNTLLQHINRPAIYPTRTFKIPLKNILKPPLEEVIGFRFYVKGNETAEFLLTDKQASMYYFSHIQVDANCDIDFEIGIGRITARWIYKDNMDCTELDKYLPNDINKFIINEYMKPIGRCWKCDSKINYDNDITWHSYHDKIIPFCDECYLKVGCDKKRKFRIRCKLRNIPITNVNRWKGIGYDVLEDIDSLFTD